MVKPRISSSVYVKLLDGTYGAAVVTNTTVETCRDSVSRFLPAPVESAPVPDITYIKKIQTK